MSALSPELILLLAKSLFVGKASEEAEVQRATWPSGKAEVCKTSIHRFESGRRLRTRIDQLDLPRGI